MGHRAQNYEYSGNAPNELLRKIELPDGVSSADIKRVTAGKFSRLALTHDGRLFHSGTSKYYQLGPNVGSGSQ